MQFSKIACQYLEMQKMMTGLVCLIFGYSLLYYACIINGRLGQPYPNSPLTVVIFAESIPAFKESVSSLYDGKHIPVTGTLNDYKGKSEIVVTKPEEIFVQ